MNAVRDKIFVLYCFVVDCEFSGDFKRMVKQLLNHFCWIDSGWARLYPCCDFFWFCSIFLFSQGLQWSIWMNFVQKITQVNLKIFSSNYFLCMISDYFWHFQPEDFFAYQNIAAHPFEENMADSAEVIWDISTHQWAKIW